MNLSILRITIDYEEDFNFVAEIFKNLDSESIKSLPKIIAFLKENDQITQIHQHHKQLDLSESVKIEIDSYFKNNYIEILETKQKITESKRSFWEFKLFMFFMA